MTDCPHLGTSDYMTLAEITKRLPPLNGKRLHTSTVFRWCKNGIRGIHLKYAKIGRVIVISETDLNHFFAALAQAEQPKTFPITRRRRRRRSTDRQRAIEHANLVLQRAGILTAGGAR